MNNYVILKWGSLKAYDFDDKFCENNKEIVKDFENIWEEIYSTRISAIGGSDYLQSKKELKEKLVNVLEKLYELGVIFQNGWSDEYYNTFKDIKDYILEYGD